MFSALELEISLFALCQKIMNLSSIGTSVLVVVTIRVAHYGTKVSC